MALLSAFEARADDTFISLTAQMRKNLELLARLTRELVPQPSVVNTTNNFMLFEHPEYVQVIAALSMGIAALPEARQGAVRRRSELAPRRYKTTATLQAPPSTSAPTRRR